jgi:3-hydroxyacyl-CoA dehydrogenase
MSEGIKTVGVLGLGVMGFDIAFLYAQKGCRTSVPMVYAVMARRRGPRAIVLQRRSA